MDSKIYRDSVIYARVQKKNHLWIKQQMKKYGYSGKSGKSEFIDNMISDVRGFVKAGRLKGTKKGR